MNMELIARAEEQKKQIEMAMDDIRNTAAYINTIADNYDKLQVTLQGAGNTIYINSILSKEEAEAIKVVITRDIQTEHNKKENLLAKLLGIEQEKDKVEKEIAVPVVTVEPIEAIKEVKQPEVIEKPKKVELNADEVRELYINQDMTLQQVAEAVGCGRTKVYDFCRANGIIKPSKKDKEYRDGDKIYTPSKPHK